MLVLFFMMQVNLIPSISMVMQSYNPYTKTYATDMIKEFCIADLLYKFFLFFGCQEFDHVLCPYSGMAHRNDSMPSHRTDYQNSESIIVQDPLEANLNISRSLQSDKLKKFKQECRRAAFNMKKLIDCPKDNSLESLFFPRQDNDSRECFFPPPPPHIMVDNPCELCLTQAPKRHSY